jgi:hypothetical protein
MSGAGRARPHLRLLALVGLALCGCSGTSARGQNAPLVLERTIALKGVAGRIDHLAYDASRSRLFVAELGNGSVESIDLASGRSVGRIGGLREPQGVAFLPARDELAVASGGDGTLRFYRGADLAPVGVMQIGSDPDNLRVDPATGRLVVGYGSGALALIDPATRRIVVTTALPAHPEGFQLDGDLAYVNLPEAGRIAAVNFAQGRVLATWATSGLRFNFPLALDPGGRAFAAAYRFPARLALFDRATGARRQSLAACGDADDLFFDKPRARLYMICGQGVVDVFGATGSGYQHAARVTTRSGARTGLFVPALDRLFIAARAQGGADAALFVYRPQP